MWINYKLNGISDEGKDKLIIKRCSQRVSKSTLNPQKNTATKLANSHPSLCQIQCATLSAKLLPAKCECIWNIGWIYGAIRGQLKSGRCFFPNEFVWKLFFFFSLASKINSIEPILPLKIEIERRLKTSKKKTNEIISHLNKIHCMGLSSSLYSTNQL